MEINLKEVVWNLLEQWKAILIVALLMALLVSGAKYVKDSRAYSAKKAEMDMEAQTDISADERIEEILSALPENERLTAEYLIKQNEWLDAEKDYVGNSILFKTDPTNQRTLILDYFIEETDDSRSVATALAYGYAGIVTNERVAEAVGRIIDPEAERKYIAELISCGDKSGYNPIPSTDENAMLEVRIILPEETDAQAVEVALTETLREQSTELSKTVGVHSIKLVESGESYLYNNDAVNNRNNVLYSIYNLTNNNKNIQSSLSEGQRSAVAQITQIKSTKGTEGLNKDEEAETLSKPGFSKKYVLLGFVLGAMAYAFLYLAWLILRGCINYASDVETYTGARLLGEIHAAKKQGPLSFIMTSKAVEKIRYRDRLDADKLISNTASAIAAMCKREDIKSIANLNMTSWAEDVIKNLDVKGVKQNIIEVNSIEEGEFLNIKDAILTIGNKTKLSDLGEVLKLCQYYDVNILGTVFVGD